MYPFPIGIILDSFRTDIKTAVSKAAALGVQGLQVYATQGEMSPEQLIGEKRSQFLDLVKSNGLEISALCGDLGQGFTDREKNPELIERSKRILDLAKELGTNIVTTHIGIVPENSGSDTYKIMQDACRELAEYADSLCSHFAVETGPESAVRLKGFLDSLESRGVAVNMDPANLVMVVADNPIEAVYTLKDYIVHTHAKDGKQLVNVPANEVYGEPKSKTKREQTYIELPLGQGDVDFPNYLRALENIGYKGFLTIEREVGENPEADIALAVEFLKNLTRK